MLSSSVLVIVLMVGEGRAGGGAVSRDRSVLTGGSRLGAAVRPHAVDRCHTCHMTEHFSTGPAGAGVAPPSDRCARLGTFPECPLCGGGLHPEHAHFKCAGCGWRDSCCD
jgi:hypothetical protein